MLPTRKRSKGYHSYLQRHLKNVDAASTVYVMIEEILIQKYYWLEL